MALNNFGMGITVTAKDVATPTLTSVGGSMKKMGQQAKEAADTIVNSFKAAKGATEALSAAAAKASAKVSSKPARTGTQALSAVDMKAAAKLTAPAAAPALGGGGTGGGGGLGGGGAAAGLFGLEMMREVRGQMQALQARADQLKQALVGLFMSAANEATMFGKSVAEVASITTRAAFPLSEIERIGKEMTSTYGGDLNLQVKTLYQAVSSGATNVAEATALMDSANKLAIGGLSDSFKAVDALTNVLNAYNMKMTEAAQVSDALFVAAKIGKTTIDELASQIGRLAPTASAMGVSMDDMMAAVTGASTQLGNGTAAVDGFKEALSSILKPTSDAAKEAKKLGIDFSMGGIKAAGGFNKFFNSILTSGKFSQDTIKNLWGGSTTAFNAMSALAANGGKSFNEAAEGMRTKAGATEFAFQTMADTADFAQTVLRGNLQTALVNLGQVVAPVIGAVLGVFNKLLVAFNKAPPFVHKLTAVVGMIVAGLAALMSSLLGAGIAITGLIIAGKALLIGLAVAGIAVGALVAAFVPLIAIIGTLYMVWTKNLGGIQTSVMVWYSRVSMAVRGIAMLFSSGQLSGALMEELNGKGAEGIKAFVVTIYMWFGRVRNFFRNVWTSFSAGLNDIGPVINKIAMAFQSLVGALVPVGKTGSSAKDTFEQFGRAGAIVGKVLVKVIAFVADGIFNLIQFIRGAVGVFNNLKPALSAVWDAAVGLANAFGILFTALTRSGSGTTSNADGWKMFGQIVGTVANTILGTIVVAFRILAGVIEWVAGIVGAFQVIFDGIVTGIVLGFKFISAVLSGDGTTAWAVFGQMVDNVINTIVQSMLKLVGGAAGMIDSLGKIFGADLGLKVGLEKAAGSPGAQSNIGKPLTPGVPTGTPDTPLPKWRLDAPGESPGVPKANTMPTANGSPAIANSQQNAGNTQALQQLASQKANPPPVTVDFKHTTVLDGSVIAENTSKHQAQQAGRGFGPLPAPT